MSAPPNRKSPSQFGQGSDQLGGIDQGEGYNNAAVASSHGFASNRAAALALLQSDTTLTRKAGSFLGQLCTHPAPLTQAQAEWLDKLLTRADLPV